MARYFRPLVLGFVLVFAFAGSGLQSQSPAPQTYSLTAVSLMTEISMFTGRESNVQVYRNGSKELAEVKIAPQGGESKGAHMRYLFDLAAHKAYMLNLQSNNCSWMRYVSAEPPVGYDPIGSSAAMLAELAKQKTKVVGTETLNGIPARIEEVSGPPEQGKARIWIALQGNFVIKYVLVGPDGKPIPFFELKQVSYGKPADSLFVPPANCSTQTAGEWSATGVSAHAETSVEVQGSGSANLATGQAQGEATLRASNPASAQSSPTPAASRAGGQAAPPAQGQGRVTEVRLHEPALQKFDGPCGSYLDVNATITTTAPGTVWYRFLGPGGLSFAGGPEGKMTFGSAGQGQLGKGVNFTESRSGEIRLEVAMMIGADRHGPVLVSAPIAFHFNCGGAPSGTGGGTAPAARGGGMGATSPQGSRVTEVRMHLVPESYSGPCPGHVQLVGEITADGPGTVWYRFLAGAVSHSPEGTVTFDAAGTKTVTLDGAFRTAPRVPHASLIAIMEDEAGNHGPRNLSSGPVNYNITCAGQAPPGK